MEKIIVRTMESGSSCWVHLINGFIEQWWWFTADPRPYIKAIESLFSVLKENLLHHEQTVMERAGFIIEKQRFREGSVLSTVRPSMLKWHLIGVGTMTLDRDTCVYVDLFEPSRHHRWLIRPSFEDHGLACLKIIQIPQMCLASVKTVHSLYESTL